MSRIERERESLLDKCADPKWNNTNLTGRIFVKARNLMCSLVSVRLCVFMKIYFVTHEMCRKRAKEREREANYLFYFLPLNRFQLLFNLERDILSFSYSHRTVINWTLVASKGTVIESNA